MLAPDVLAYVLATLDPDRRRVLEIGAGDGELAVALRGQGYDVTAIDPKGGADGVQQLPLIEVEGVFDAAVAIVSLHHVEPLAESVAHLAGLLESGAPLIVDELDVDRLDDRAMRWWSSQQRAIGSDKADKVDGMAEAMRAHIHSLATVRGALAEHFWLGEAVRGAYMHRWWLPPGLRDVEEHLIGTGVLPAMGARFVAVRR